MENELMENLVKCMVENKQKLSKLKEEAAFQDKLLVDYYHLIEFGKFPAHIKSGIIKEMESCLKTRRSIKNEIEKLEALQSAVRKYGFNIHHLPKQGKKTYKFKSDATLFKKYLKYLKAEFAYSI
jgi:hypothetical protein